MICVHAQLEHAAHVEEHSLPNIRYFYEVVIEEDFMTFQEITSLYQEGMDNNDRLIGIALAYIVQNLLKERN